MTVNRSASVGFKTLEEAVEIAECLAPKFRERVGRTEELRRLPEETVADLTESGLLSIETPRRWGGPELSLDALLEVTGALAQGCPSTGWVYALWASHVWLIGQFPEHIQAQVFSEPNVRISSVINTEGVAERVPGGFVWTGHGYFCSGVDYCSWLTAALDVPAREGCPPERHWMLLPRSDFEIVDDWHTIGLVGTGSKSIVLDSVFVPDERIVNARKLSQGDGVGATLHGSPLYCAAVDFTFSLPLPAAELGIARAAVQEFQRLCQERLAGGTRRLAAEQAATLMRFALASAEVEAAHTLLLSDARRFCSVTAKEATALDRAQCRRDVSFATQMCRRAVNSLFEAAGGFYAYRPSDLQRLWRDSNVAAAHHGLMWDIHGLAYGRLAAGLSTTLDPVGL
jgi:3-hydroxy-9,10-secoandrosta-1,3,5(10)-triene-9,17-dione monooxygenase